DSSSSPPEDAGAATPSRSRMAFARSRAMAGAILLQGRSRGLALFRSVARLHSLLLGGSMPDRLARNGLRLLFALAPLAGCGGSAGAGRSSSAATALPPVTVRRGRPVPGAA